MTTSVNADGCKRLCLRAFQDGVRAGVINPHNTPICVQRGRIVGIGEFKSTPNFQITSPTAHRLPTPQTFEHNVKMLCPYRRETCGTLNNSSLSARLKLTITVTKMSRIVPQRRIHPHRCFPALPKPRSLRMCVLNTGNTST